MKKIFIKISSKIPVVIVLILTIIFNVKCNKDCLKSAGQIDSLTITLKPFTDIHIYDLFDVELKQDSFYEIKIITNSTLLNNIYVNDDTALVVMDKNICYFARDPEIKRKLVITVPELNKMIFYNVSSLYSEDTLYFHRFLYQAIGKLTFVDLKVSCDDHFFISLWNISGDVSVAGYCKYLSILNHGNAYIEAFELNSEYAQIEQRSTGDIKVNVQKGIKATIQDIGNIYYKGNPTLDTVITGAGKMINVN